MGLVLRRGFLRSALFIYFFISSFVPGKQSESIVYGNTRGCCRHCFCGVSAVCSYERRDFSICFSPNRQIYAGFYNADETLITTAFGDLFIGCLSFVKNQNNIPKTFCSSSNYQRFISFIRLRRKWCKQRIPYYLNSCACFNVMELRISLSGDIHLLPGPENSSNISVHVGNRQNRSIPEARGHVSANCTRVQLTKKSQAAVHKNQNKFLKIAHLHAELLKCRQLFFSNKGVGLGK